MHCRVNARSVDPVLFAFSPGGFGSSSSTADPGTTCCQYLNQHVQGSPGENNILLEGDFLNHIYLHCAKVSVG